MVYCVYIIFISNLFLFILHKKNILTYSSPHDTPVYIPYPDNNNLKKLK